MKAEIVGGQHIQIYPENADEEKVLRRFQKEGANEVVGGTYQKIKNGVALPEKKLVMLQFTVKGTLLEPTKE